MIKYPFLRLLGVDDLLTLVNVLVSLPLNLFVLLDEPHPGTLLKEPLVLRVLLLLGDGGLRHLLR